MELEIEVKKQLFVNFFDEEKLHCMKTNDDLMKRLEDLEMIMLETKARIAAIKDTIRDRQKNTN